MLFCLHRRHEQRQRKPPARDRTARICCCILLLVCSQSVNFGRGPKRENGKPMAVRPAWFYIPALLKSTCYARENSYSYILVVRVQLFTAHKILNTPHYLTPLLNALTKLLNIPLKFFQNYSNYPFTLKSNSFSKFHLSSLFVSELAPPQTLTMVDLFSFVLFRWFLRFSNSFSHPVFLVIFIL